MESKSKLCMDMFSTLSVIGKGSYAKVLLVQRNDTGDLNAMKILKKEMVEKKNQEKHIRVERHILSEIDHPFVIKFHGSFQNEKKLFFVLEYCRGGELFNLLAKKRRFSEDQTRFYAAQIVLALEHLHNQDIVYRDLKPENVLIDEKGYIRITDFGLSRTGVKDASGARSICGTPEYLAPEIVLRLEYGKAVDWWTLGSIIYEMLVGAPPFYVESRPELFERIKFDNPKFPSSLSQNARNLIECLLKKDPAKRLGTTSKVRDHPWFEDVNWDALLKMQYEAPFVPKLTSEADLQHFDPEFTEIPINSMSMSGGTMQKYKQYDGFSYNAADGNNPDKMNIEK
jgi:serum/glucocorticoid-regulated kinase 2